MHNGECKVSSGNSIVYIHRLCVSHEVNPRLELIRSSSLLILTHTQKFTTIPPFQQILPITTIRRFWSIIQMCRVPKSTIDLLFPMKLQPPKKHPNHLIGQIRFIIWSGSLLILNNTQKFTTIPPFQILPITTIPRFWSTIEMC